MSETSTPEKKKAERIAAARAALRQRERDNPGELSAYEVRRARLEAIAKRERAAQRGWRILRTSSNRTLRLARSLAQAGFDVWTPISVQLRSRPRSSIKVERNLAMMPSFVFVRATQIGAVAAAAVDPRRPHPPFFIHTLPGSVNIVAEHELAPMRTAEAAEAAAYAKRKEDEARTAAMSAAKAERERHRRLYEEGAAVVINKPAFAGLQAVVTKGGRAAVTVRLMMFGQIFEGMKVDTCDLLPVNV